MQRALEVQVCDVELELRVARGHGRAFEIFGNETKRRFARQRRIGRVCAHGRIDSTAARHKPAVGIIDNHELKNGLA